MFHLEELLISGRYHINKFLTQLFYANELQTQKNKSLHISDKQQFTSNQKSGES